MYLHSCIITYIHVPSDKTPPMSPRRVARDVIETLDTDGNGKKLFFISLKDLIFYCTIYHFI